jgi:hypothetical protein
VHAVIQLNKGQEPLHRKIEKRQEAVCQEDNTSPQAKDASTPENRLALSGDATTQIQQSVAVQRNHGRLFLVFEQLKEGETATAPDGHSLRADAKKMNEYIFAPVAPACLYAFSESATVMHSEQSTTNVTELQGDCANLNIAYSMFSMGQESMQHQGIK